MRQTAVVAGIILVTVLLSGCTAIGDNSCDGDRAIYVCTPDPASTATATVKPAAAPAPTRTQ